MATALLCMTTDAAPVSSEPALGPILLKLGQCLSLLLLRPPPPDEDECTHFPSVCPLDRPVCVNTYGSYKCRAKRRCNQGFEPSDDGSACVGEWCGSTREDPARSAGSGEQRERRN